MGFPSYGVVLTKIVYRVGKSGFFVVYRENRLINGFFKMSHEKKLINKKG
jgi:hypothetical protein